MGGPSRNRRIGPWLVALECGVLALVLLSCGDGGTAPARLGEPDAGDERPPVITVRLRATERRLTVRPRKVTAFLPLRFVLHSTADGGSVVFHVAGQDAVEVGPGATDVLRSKGERPGRLRVTAGRGRRASLRVVAGG